MPEILLILLMLWLGGLMFWIFFSLTDKGENVL